MKIVSYSYGHEDLSNPKVQIKSGFWFFGRVRNYVCLSVGFLAADWVCAETGRKVSSFGKDFRLYWLLNETGAKAQLEAMEACK